MARVLGFVALAAVLCAGLLAIYAYRQVSGLEVARVSDDVHVLYGLGGNVGVLRTSEGSAVVDTMTFPMQGRAIEERARELAGPVQLVVNTHYHLDHTHGNPAFPAGLRVISTDRTRAYLDRLDPDFWQGDAAQRLPNETFVDERSVRLGGKTLRLLHPGRGHTDGDLVVLFVEDRVLHTGDLFFNGRYPNIDLEAGGSVLEWSNTIDRLLELDFDQVIPGHGPVTDAAGLREFQRFMRQLAAVAEEASRSGRPVADLQASAAMDADAGYEVVAIPFVMRLDRDFVLQRAWEEGTDDFERVEIRGEE